MVASTRIGPWLEKMDAAVAPPSGWRCGKLTYLDIYLQVPVFSPASRCTCDGQHCVCFCCFWMLLKYVWSWLETDACDNEIQILNPAEWRGNLHKMPSASSKCIKSWACLVTCDMTKTNTCLLWFTVMHEAPCIHSMSLVPPSILDLNVTRDRFTSQVGVWEKCICSICIFQMWSMPKTGCLVCRWTST